MTRTQALFLPFILATSLAFTSTGIINNPRGRNHANSNKLSFFKPYSSDFAATTSNRRLKFLLLHSKSRTKGDDDEANNIRKATATTTTRTHHNISFTPQAVAASGIGVSQRATVSSKVVSSSSGSKQTISKSKQTLSCDTTNKPVPTTKVATNKLEQGVGDTLRWNTRLEQLIEYKQQHGDCLIPSTLQGNRALGRWAYRQRQLYKQLPKQISDERIQRLEEIGFEWSIIPVDWESRFKELLRYKEQHGDCLVPCKFSENPQFGVWVHRQRAAYKGLHRTMSAEHIQRLDDIGFEWDPLQAQWEARFREFVEHQQKHPDCMQPQDFQENPPLKNWVNRQRAAYSSVPRAISDERIQRLNECGFEWETVQSSQWETRFRNLVEYKQQHGDCLVPYVFPDNRQFGRWVHAQRQLYSSVPKRISDDRIRRLNDIGFEWDVFRAQWESLFRELLEYKRQHGHCMVPRMYQDSRKLGSWVSLQRGMYRKVPKKISAEYIQRLNDIGFAWIACYVQWEEGFEDLVKYKQQYGDCMVPKPFPDNPLLGRWVQQQRKSYNKEPKRISDNRIQRLENIGFEWETPQALWDLRFEQLLEYKRQYGDVAVPRGFRDNPQLANWVHQQRNLYRKRLRNSATHLISEERIQQLEEIGFVWKVYKTQWEQRFEQLREYKQLRGDCFVPAQFDENPHLGVWVQRQRQIYKCEPKIITPERIQRLEDIGFEWEGRNNDDSGGRF